MINSTVKEDKLLMEMFLKESLYMDKKMARVCISGKIDLLTMVIGRMTCSKGKESMSGQMGEFIMDFGTKI